MVSKRCPIVSGPMRFPRAKDEVVGRVRGRDVVDLGEHQRVGEEDGVVEKRLGDERPSRRAPVRTTPRTARRRRRTRARHRPEQRQTCTPPPKKHGETPRHRRIAGRCGQWRHPIRLRVSYLPVGREGQVSFLGLSRPPRRGPSSNGLDLATSSWRAPPGADVLGTLSDWFAPRPRSRSGNPLRGRLR